MLFGIWETRVKDYRAFAEAKRQVAEKPSFPQTDNHPAVNISWDNAKAFCAWLSEKEGRKYRLPTDDEWSVVVGVGEREPPKDAGNYHPSLNIDSFENTAPVGSFAANRFGLYDLGGNVWEWCEDIGKAGDTSRVVRGGSFLSHIRHVWLSSPRTPESLHTLRHYGFRCVLDLSAVRQTGEGSLRNAVLATKPTRPFTGTLPGTVWFVRDSVGDEYYFEFLDNGVLNYEGKSGLRANGKWRQEGATVIIEINDGVAKLTGTLSGRQMRGDAYSTTAGHWTWEATPR